MKTLYFITGPSLCQRHDASALKGHVCVDCLLESICGHEIRSMKEIMAGVPYVITTPGSSFQPDPTNL